ncbi:BLOC-1-related complex subunit 8-like [Antedon mediterranea]|uniref:BLOC-1-related complex subunit 8-like n=1 Tax=Antedon mediterranea TaxID=105859 RepID=UPI003AF41E71
MDRFSGFLFDSGKANSSDNLQEPEMDNKVRRVTEKFSESLHIVANDPSLAMYRIQEHIRKSLPHQAQCKADLTLLHQDVKGHSYDVSYAISAVEAMHDSKTPFSNIESLLKSSIYHKQQLNERSAALRVQSKQEKRSSISSSPQRQLLSGRPSHENASTSTSPKLE